MTPEQLNEARAVAGNLTKAQRRGMLDAYTLSGPSGDTFVYDQKAFDALYFDDEHDLVTPGGRLLPLGLAVKSILQEHPHG